jgi:hypothetical protein
VHAVTIAESGYAPRVLGRSTAARASVPRAVNGPAVRAGVALDHDGSLAGQHDYCAAREYSNAGGHVSLHKAKAQAIVVVT